MFFGNNRGYRSSNHFLSRNLDNMRLAGVCSGIASKLGIDCTFVRIVVLFVELSTEGSLFLVYLLLAFLLPAEHLG